MALDDRIAEFFDGPASRGLVAAYLFGSRAEGRSHRESDVDIAVLLDFDAFPEAAARFEKRVRLSAELAPVTGSNENDVVVLNDAPPLLARRILREGRRLFCAEESRERAFRRDVQLKAADLAPFMERARRRTLAALLR